MFLNSYMRADAALPLSDDQIRRAAPSVFADEVSSHVSSRYRMVTTSSVVAGMRDAGFFPVAVMQSASKLPGGEMFAKHMLRFRHADALALAKKQEYEEVILTTAHDGTSSFQLDLGLFRLVCQNGLIVGRTAGRVTIPHVGDAVGMVIEGATRVLEDVREVIEARDSMKAITLSPHEQTTFAQAALTLWYGENSPITPEQVLRVRRIGDFDPSLWNTFNAVQENMIKGGMSGFAASGRRTRTRAITSISTDMAVNRMLWSLADAARNMKETLDLDGMLEEAENAIAV